MWAGIHPGLPFYAVIWDRRLLNDDALEHPRSSKEEGSTQHEEEDQS